MNSNGSRIDEIADGIFRISTPVPPSEFPGGFSFNQFLILDDAPALFHAGLRMIYPAVKEAIEKVVPVSRLRYVAFSHFESDECGALNRFLADAPDAEPVCSRTAVAVSVGDFSDRPPRAVADGEVLTLGKRSLKWIDVPHMPHAWECGYMMEEHTSTLFCGDLFTQGGHETPPLTEGDILGPSEGLRGALDYYSHTKNGAAMLERLAEFKPDTLACMHGSSFRGDGAQMLRALGHSLDESMPDIVKQVIQG
jgi:flavorubredoxin